MKTRIIMILVAAFGFATICFAVPAKIDTLQVVQVRGYDIKLSLAVPTATTAVTLIELRMSGVNIVAMNYASRTIFTTITIPAGTPAGTVIPITVIGLTPNTQYYLGGKAKDTVWATLVSNVLAVTTKGPTRECVITWQLVNDGSGSSNIDGFVLHYGDTIAMQTDVVLPSDRYSQTVYIPWGSELYAQVSPYIGTAFATSNIAYTKL